MQTDLRNRDLIGDLDFSKEEVETVMDVAFDLKRKRALGESHAYLRDKVLAMLFFFSSTRTRGSFEAGMAQLGGHAAFIESKTTQIAHGDTPKEIGEIFGRYFDGIAIRHVDWGIGNGYLNAVAPAARKLAASASARAPWAWACTITATPSAARRLQMAAPIGLLPPVTRARLMIRRPE